MKSLARTLSLSLTGLALCLSLAPLSLADSTTVTNISPPTLSVTGEGKVVVPADRATIAVTIESVESSFRAARVKNNQIYSDLKSSLATLGVDGKDINIDYTYGMPNYEYGDKNVRKVTNYTVDYNISIQVRDLAKLDTITDKLSDFETLNLSNTTYSTDNLEQATDQAREKAVTNALNKAQKLAKLYHLNLGRVTSLNESSYPSSPSYYTGSNYASNSVELSLTLSVSYELN